MASPAVLSPARKISAALSLCQRFPGINSTLMDLPDLAAAPFSCHGTHRGPGCETTTRQHGALCLRLGQDHELWPGFLSVLPVSWFGAGRARAHCAKTGCSAPKMEPQELSADFGVWGKGMSSAHRDGEKPWGCSGGGCVLRRAGCPVCMLVHASCTRVHTHSHPCRCSGRASCVPSPVPGRSECISSL